MSNVAAVLIAVAKELATEAKNSFPELKEGEVLKKEWFSNGIYYRATELNGKSILRQFNFRQRKTALTSADE